MNKKKYNFFTNGGGLEGGLSKLPFPISNRLGLRLRNMDLRLRTEDWGLRTEDWGKETKDYWP